MSNKGVGTSSTVHLPELFLDYMVFPNNILEQEQSFLPPAFTSQPHSETQETNVKGWFKFNKYQILAFEKKSK